MDFEDQTLAHEVLLLVAIRSDSKSMGMLPPWGIMMPVGMRMLASCV
jgi:hypothetical protein